MIKKNTIALIPARAGSQGLPNKNIQLLKGLPLYKHSVNQAITAGLEKIFISTDIEEILSANLPEKCLAVQRPTSLARNNTTMVDVLLHFIDQQQIPDDNNIVLLQPTSPLRSPEQIHQAIELFSRSNASMVMSVCKTDSGILKYGILEGSNFMPISDPDYCFSNRQSLPSVFRPNGAIYVFNVAEFVKYGNFPIKDIRVIEMLAEDSIDIDIQSDLIKCEKVFNKRDKNK